MEIGAKLLILFLRRQVVIIASIAMCKGHSHKMRVNSMHRISLVAVLGMETIKPDTCCLLLGVNGTIGDNVNQLSLIVNHCPLEMSVQVSGGASTRNYSIK